MGNKIEILSQDGLRQARSEGVSGVPYYRACFKLVEQSFSLGVYWSLIQAKMKGYRT